MTVISLYLLLLNAVAFGVNYVKLSEVNPKSPVLALYVL